MYLHYDLFIILFEMTQVTASEIIYGALLSKRRLVNTGLTIIYSDDWLCLIVDFILFCVS